MTSTPFDTTPEAHEKAVNAYREARAARLTADKGWLTLVDKVWLSNGVYRLGSEPGSEIELPSGRAPERVATITVSDGEVRLDAAKGVGLQARGGPIESIVLRSDTDEAPDSVVLGSFTFELIRRADDLALRVRDSESLLRRTFAGIPAFPIDPSWRVVARYERHPKPREVIFYDGDGRPQPFVSQGMAVFERAGATYRLEPVLEGQKRLFVLFSDLTNRTETYGGGRFLYAAFPEQERILLDFNLAFNPPCAFTPYATCPLPSADNHLNVAVEAGEKRPRQTA